MPFDLVASTTAGETYCTSAEVSSITNTISLSAAELTDIIVRMQYRVDGKLRRKYVTPFTAGSVPRQINLATLWYSAQAALEGTYFGELATQAGGDMSLLSLARTYERQADEMIRQVLTGETTLILASGTIVDPITAENEVVIVTPATPIAKHVLVTDISLVDIGAFSVVVKLRATSGTPTGIVVVFGVTDEGEPKTESFSFAETGDRYGEIAWKYLTSVDSSRVTGGTGVTVGVSAVSNRSPDSGGGILAV